MSARRIEKLEKWLTEYYDALDKYESQLIYTTDPLEQRKIKEGIAFVNQQIAEKETELELLQQKMPVRSAEETGPVFAPVENPMERHYSELIDLLARGRVVIILGADINLCGRPTNMTWRAGGEFPPTSGELAQYLAENFDYPGTGLVDLARVSQYASIKHRPGPLYDKLRQIFEADYRPNQLHQFLARLPGLLRRRNERGRYPIFITTNYDSLLEQAFKEAGEPFDLLAYVSEGEQGNKFLHWSSGSDQAIQIDDPSNYRQLQLEQRPVILKMNRVFDQLGTGQDRWVVTEDQFINYMSRQDISKLIPAKIMEQLRNGSLLFMGYHLEDWSLRVMLHRIWSEREHRINDYPSWAVEAPVNLREFNFWDKWDVKLIEARLEDYVEELNERLGGVAASEMRR